MADQDFLDALSDCIDRLSQGQSAGDCARRYPQFTTRLLPMLETRAVVRRAQPGALEVGQARDRVRFKMQAHRRRHPLVSLARIAGSLAVALVVIVAAGAFLAEDSLPGDSLYGLKRVTENVRASLSSDPTSIDQEFEHRRLNEIARLLALKRVAEVDFQGEVQATSSPDWQIADQRIRVAPDVPGAQAITAGDRVRVQASTTAQGELVASAISLIEKATPTIVPSPTPVTSSTPTATATQATATQTATASPTPEPTPAPRATATRAVRATLLPPPPTAIPGIAPAPTGESSPGGDDHSGKGNNSGSGSGSSGGGDNSGSSDGSGKDGGGSGSGGGGSGKD